MLIESSKVRKVKHLVWPQVVLENTFIYLLSNTLVMGCESDILYPCFFLLFMIGRSPNSPMRLRYFNLQSIFAIAEINEETCFIRNINLIIS